MGADYVRHGLVVPVVIDSGIISIGLCHTLWYAVSAWQGSRSRRALRGIFCRRRGRTFQHWIGLLWNQNFYTGSKNQGKQDLEYEWCNMAESTKISSLTRGIPKFDGNALKYEEWKTVTLAVLEISRNDMFEILTGESARPREVYTSPARTDTRMPRCPAEKPLMGTANKLEQVTKTQGEQESTLQQYKLLRLPQPFGRRVTGVLTVPWRSKTLQET